MDTSSLFASLEQQNGLPSGLLDAVYSAESGRGKYLTSPKGAQGPFQFMPGTASQYGLKNPNDLTQSASAAASYLADLSKKYGGDVPTMLAAYNWGPGNVDKNGIGNAPAETKNYVSKVTASMPQAQGRDLSAELFGGSPQASTQPQGRDLSAELFGGQPAKAPPIAGGVDPTSGMSTAEKIAAGTGKAVVDTGRGLGQLARMALPTSVADTLGLPTQASIDESKRLDAPLMNTGAGLGGNVLGNAAMILLPAGGVARGAAAASKAAEAVGAARTAGALGRVSGVASQFVNPTTYTGAIGAGAAIGAAQPVASDDSRGFNVLAGGATGGLGNAVVNTLGRIAQPVKNALDPLQQKAIDTLTNAGVPLDLSQLTGSPFWNRVRSSLSDNLFTVGGQEAKKAEQSAAFNRAVLKTAGADAPAATKDVMGGIRDQSNAVIGDVLSRNNVQLSPQSATTLAGIQSSAIENEKGPVAKIINRFFDSVDPQTGQISGQVAYNVKKDLDMMAQSNDSTLRNLAIQTRSAVMDAINNSLSGADQQAFAQARGNMANMFKIENAVSADGLGNISPSKLANTLSQKANRNASVYGRGPQDLVELAQSGKQVLPDKTNNSGTAARLLAATAPGALVGLGTGLATGDWTDAAKYGSMTLAAPKAAQFLLNSPTVSAVLARGVTNPTLRAILEGPQTNPAIGQLVRQSPNALIRYLALPAAQQ